MKLGFFSKLFISLILILTSLLILDFFPYLLNKDLGKKRTSILSRNQKAISVAVVSPKGKYKQSFIKGLKTAQQKINSRLDMPYSFYLDFYDENKSSALEIARDLNHSAVIGYSDPKISENAGMIFSKSNLLFMHFSTSNAMRSSNISKTFTIVPSNKLLAKAIIKRMADKMLRKAYVVVSRKDTYHELHLALYPGLIKTDIKVTGKFSYFEDKVNFSKLISGFDKDKFDCVIFIGEPENCALFTHNFRNLGFTEGIIYPEKLGDDLTTLKTSKKDRENLLIIKGYNTQDETPLNKEFVKSFTSSFSGEIPNEWSALGFESLMLLADVAKQTNSKDPYDLANFLYFNQEFEGLTDTLIFNKEGHLKGRSLYGVEFKNDRTETNKYFIQE